MGNYVSEFTDTQNGNVAKSSHPSKDNWITEHATATGLAIVEIERLWYRFKMMGCNDNGILEAEVLQRPPASEDIFVKNVLVTFRSVDGNITFQSFCNAMKWAETSSLDIKMRAIFNMLNNGSKVSKDLLSKVLKRTFSDLPQSKINEITDTFMKQMDPRRTGHITEQQWLQWSRNLPQDELEALLEFSIIPPEINEEAHRSFTSQAYSTQPPRTRLLPHPRSRAIPESPADDEPPPRRIPNDDLLSKIARKVQKYDWLTLGNKMGYTSEQLQSLQKKYPNDKHEQVYSLLKTWRKREKENATYENLEQLLTSCRMNDAAMLLF